MKNELKEVFWTVRYPRRIENRELLLKQKTWGRRLIYDVYLGKNLEFLGTCHILEKKNYIPECNCDGECINCNDAFVVGKKIKCACAFVAKELTAPSKEKSQKLQHRLKEIQQMFRESI